MFIVGIDIAKRSHEAIIIAEDGQVVRKAFSFRNNCTATICYWNRYGD